MDKRLTPTIVKLGGSVITVKEREFTPDPRTIERVAQELAAAMPHSLIVIHGGGSFGHPVAKKYGVIEGYHTPDQLLGFSKTRQAMMALNKLLIDTFLRHDLPVVTIQPSACLVTQKGRIHGFDVTAVTQLLAMNFIPVLYGDAVMDIETGFTILSGDQLAAHLAILFEATRLVIAVDVDGLFTDDPKSHPEATLLPAVSLRGLKTLLERIGESPTLDVTKGMYGKMSEIIPALEQGVQIQMVNARRRHRLYKALKGESVRGTTITPE
jgi:isopentenyl phosphate kinase